MGCDYLQKQAINPILPAWEYIPDGEAHVFGDRVYLFGSHDKEAGDTFCMLDYAGWSAPVDDLGNWECSGVIYSAKQDPLYDPEKLPHMYAPDVVQGNDGRFYLYYCMSGYAGKGGYSNPISVAVCDTPNGKYEYLGIVKNPDGSPLMRYVCFDPAVINDNGTIRLYYGTVTPWLDQIPFKWIREKVYSQTFGRTVEQLRAVPEGITGAYHITLADDMMTETTQPRRIDNAISGAGYKGHGFFEGSSMRKVGDTYYFVYSSLKNHELCYATSKYPDREFKFGGTIVSNGDVGYQGRRDKDRLNHTGTTHGGIECINGQWYVFYHRLTHLSDYSRQACAEKITILPDGAIPQVEITSCGLNNGPLSGEGTYPAVCCCNLTNGKMRHGSNQNKGYDAPMVTSGNNERYVGGIGDKTLIGYKYYDLGEAVSLTVKLRGSFSGTMDICTALDGNPVASIKVNPDNGWTDYTVHWKQAAGTYPVYFRFHGKGNAELLDFTLAKK